jgi:hypothetical protein
MIVSGIAQLSNPGFPHQVFADVGSAAQLVAGHLAHVPAHREDLVVELTAVIASLRDVQRRAAVGSQVR